MNRQARNPVLFKAYGLDYHELSPRPVGAHAALEMVFSYFERVTSLSRHELSIKGKGDGRIVFSSPSTRNCFECLRAPPWLPQQADIRLPGGAPYPIQQPTV